MQGSSYPLQSISSVLLQGVYMLSSAEIEHAIDDHDDHMGNPLRRLQLGQTCYNTASRTEGKSNRERCSGDFQRFGLPVLVPVLQCGVPGLQLIFRALNSPARLVIYDFL